MSPHGAILRMRLSRLRNHFLNLKKDSAAKFFVVLFGLANVVAIGLWVSYRSFEFVEGFVFGPGLNAKLIGLLFFSLLILVTLSTILIAYTTLFIARETEFFFNHPIPPRSILLAKTGEAVSFSAWASLFLCLPVLVSFGLLRGAPFSYYLEATVILVTFLVFAGILGTTITLLLAPIIRRLGPRPLILAGCVTLALLTWVFLRSFDFWALDGKNNLLVLDRFMSGIRAMQSSFSPSRWASEAVLAACSGNHREALFQWGLLAANTLIFVPVLALYGDRLFGREWVARRGVIGSRGRARARAVDGNEAPEWNRSAPVGGAAPVAGGDERPRRDHRVQHVLCRDPVAALVLKDILVFVRNPAQVSQSLLFLLLMIIYSLSLLRIPNYITASSIKLFVHFANLGAVCMILSSFTSRFLFPLLSLEGRAFWALGLAPMPRTLLLRQKVLFGLVISLGLGLLTITASNFALRSPPELFAAAVYTMVLTSVCLTSLAAGLGAAYPSFGEDNPARIAAGLGGTLNFFASALAVALLVTLEGAPYIVFKGRPPPWAMFATHSLALLATAAICGFVLRLGGRALARSEF